VAELGMDHSIKVQEYCVHAAIVVLAGAQRLTPIIVMV